MNAWRIHAFALVTVLVLCAGGIAGAMQHAILDLRFCLHPRQPSGHVAIVAIDAPSIARIGVWPWPREIYAELLDKLRLAGVLEVAFDVDFSSRTTATADARLARALADFGGGAILPVFKQVVRDSFGMARLHTNAPLREFEDHAWLAGVNVVTEKGIARSYPLEVMIEGQWYPSLASMLAGQVSRSSSSFTVDFSLDPRRIPVFSVQDVLSGRVAGQLKGRKVIVGATAIELGDRFTVPIYGTIAGVELQALAAEDILNGRILQEAGWPLTVIGLCLIGLLALSLAPSSSVILVSVVLATVAIGLELGAIVLQSSTQIIVHTAVWHLAIGSNLVAFWLHELDLRGLLAAVAQRRFQSIALTLGDGVICTDATGAITFWNPAAVSIFNCRDTHALGRPVSHFIRHAEQTVDHADWLSRLETNVPLELVGVRSDGQTFPLEMRMSSWETPAERQYSAIVRDITARKRREERILYLALHDELSGLANRTHLRDHIKARIAKSAETRFCVLMLDFDNFKEVNDTLGHEGGDELLRQFAKSVSAVIPEGSLAGRLGGDEFAIVTDATDVALESLVSSIQNIFGSGERLTYVCGRAFALSTSIGVTEFPRGGSGVDEILSAADIALYRAKDKGRGQVVMYEAAFKAELEHRRKLEIELRSALNNGELEIHYQPQWRLDDGAIVGVEALLRWRSPKRGFMMPSEFLPVLSTGVMANVVGEWILRTACRQGAIWHARGDDLCVGVNLFASQFTPQLPAIIAAILRETGLPPQLLEIEITENILLSHDERTVQLLDDIRRLGVRVALDDFGTGYASLIYLKRFPLDRIKIDRSFVTDFGSNAANTAIVTAIVALSRQLGLATIAEGIEDAKCAQLLRLAGCDEGQGYLRGKPMLASALDLQLRQHGQHGQHRLDVPTNMSA